MIASVAAWTEALLVPVLMTAGSLLAAAVILVLVGHLIRGAGVRRRQRIGAAYRPLIDALTDGEQAPKAIRALALVPAEHRDILAGELLGLLRVSAGAAVGNVRKAARAMGLSDRWKRGLESRRWWRRAEAAHALGCIEETSAVLGLVGRLDDRHEEVRAAAVEALGRLGDPRALAPLVEGLWDDSGLQHTRVVLALREFGATAVDPLLSHERRHHAATATIADLLGAVGEASALEPLTEWCSDADPEVRAAALRALGTLGTCDRTYYYALRALGDESVDVRAAAARALARSRRREAAPYLGQALHDEWEVAVESAHGLRDLGPEGLEQLQRARTAAARALARQMIWELDRRPVRSHG
jgi:HEAT repeat protein